jgi:hypothetical protein
MHTVALEGNGSGKFIVYNESNWGSAPSDPKSIEEIIGPEGSPIVMIGVHK